MTDEREENLCDRASIYGPYPEGEPMRVKVYFGTNGTHYFPARDKRNAREIAGRIVREGCWLINDDGTEEMYPPDKIFKVKILPDNFKEAKET